MNRLALAGALNAVACGLLLSAPRPEGARRRRLACIALGWLCIAFSCWAWLTGVPS